MTDIRRSEDYDAVARRLVETKHPETGQPIFRTFMDLLVFSAMVGLSTGTRLKAGSTSLTVPESVFANRNMDGAIFLVALANTKDPNSLREKNDLSSFSVFEEFANGGLKVISDWLADNPSDISGDRTLLIKIREAMTASREAAAVDERELDNLRF